MADDATAPGTLRLRETEERMRRALGLTSDSPQVHRPQADPPRHKRRFVAEGEVPVTVLPGSGRRQAAENNERAEAERQAREAAERALAEAQAVIRDLQTRLAHAEIAVSEAQSSGLAERQRAEEAAAALKAAEQRIQALETQAAESEKAKARRGSRPIRRGEAGGEPKPVKWWLKARMRAKTQ